MFLDLITVTYLTQSKQDKCPKTNVSIPDSHRTLFTFSHFFITFTLAASHIYHRFMSDIFCVCQQIERSLDISITTMANISDG